jgi:hypothetical protein
MTTFRIVALSTGVALAAGIAMASTPFGGDDGGFIPSNKLTLTCESGIAKAVGKAAVCIGKCHAGRSSGKLADDTAENACESNNAGKSCLERFLASAAKAKSKDTTGGCGCINPNVLADQLELQLDDEMVPAVYCDATSGTLFGGDDSIVSPFGSAGFLPVANSAVAKCEDRVNQLVGNAIACILNCHNKRASGKLADDTAEDICEGAGFEVGCLATFETRVLEQPGCPSCVPVSIDSSGVDTLAGFIYCASPSGAFLP